MPRAPLGPRLYLHKRDGRPPVWVIRHGARFHSTGFREDQRRKAQEVLDGYRHHAGFLRERRQIKPPHPMPPSQRHTIYFVTCAVEGFPIKIGYATDLKLRLAALQSCLPYEIIVLATMHGHPHEERGLHIAFAHLRIRGEWFTRAPELLDYIDKLTTDSPIIGTRQSSALRGAG